MAHVADDLKFRLKNASALTVDGVEHPLRLFLTEAGAKQLDRERRFAGGPLPVGSYAGLSLTFESASVKGKRGAVALRLPQPTVRVDVPFRLGKKRAAVVSLRLHSRTSVTAAYEFKPDFSAEIAAKAPARLLGIATSCTEDTLTLFDKLTGRVVGVIPVGRFPKGVDVDPVLMLAYVAVSGEDIVEVIDLQQNRSIDRIPLLSGDRPMELALTPDRRELLVVNEGSDTLSVIDPIGLAQTDRIPVGDQPASVLVDATGRRAYVFKSLSNSISVVDLQAGAVVATVNTDPAPHRGQLNRLGDRLYVIHWDSPQLTVLDTLSLRIVSQVYVGPGASALKTNLDTDRIYLARLNAPEVEVYDPFSWLPVDSIPVRDDISYMTIDGDANNLGFVVPRRNEIRLLRVVSQETVARIDVGEDPCWVSFSVER